MSKTNWTASRHHLPWLCHLHLSNCIQLNNMQLRSLLAQGILLPLFFLSNSFSSKDCVYIVNETLVSLSVLAPQTRHYICNPIVSRPRRSSWFLRSLCGKFVLHSIEAALSRIECCFGFFQELKLLMTHQALLHFPLDLLLHLAHRQTIII